MEKENWGPWIAKLHTWNLHRVTAAVLEGLRPLHIVGAQLLYLGQPVLSTFLPRKTTTDLAQLLEDPESTQHFVDMLRTYEAH